LQFARHALHRKLVKIAMSDIRWVAIAVLYFEMPVPVYWLVLHAPVAFWRRHTRVAYLAAVFAAWGGGGWLLHDFRALLFPALPTAMPLPRVWAIALGTMLIATDVFLLTRVEFLLGGRRLVGHAELTGTGELATGGLYAYLRHPRYVGMIAAVLGTCLILDSVWLWIAAALWCLVALAAIALEERELRRRFPAYAAYARRVPALLPNPFRSRHP
jgi:protein-S-isoprenylcysteine O-methyltransferase Ste14